MFYVAKIYNFYARVILSDLIIYAPARRKCIF